MKKLYIKLAQSDDIWHGTKKKKKKRSQKAKKSELMSGDTENKYREMELETSKARGIQALF